MRLKAGEFIRRFLLHVLPDGFHRIRSFGFMANGHRATNLALCREPIEGLGEDRKAQAPPRPTSDTAGKVPVFPACPHFWGRHAYCRERPAKRPPVTPACATLHRRCDMNRSIARAPTLTEPLGLLLPTPRDRTGSALTPRLRILPALPYQAARKRNRHVADTGCVPKDRKMSASRSRTLAVPTATGVTDYPHSRPSPPRLRSIRLQ